MEVKKEIGVVKLKKRKNFLMLTFFVMLLVAMSACSNDTEDAASMENQSESDKALESADDSSQDSTVKSDESSSQEEVSSEQTESTDKKASSEANENVQKDEISKIEGRKTEFIERLDNIQKKLDEMPDKKDSDKGVTNAMKNYYGISYETYDQELNEIYALLQKELSPQTMKDLKAEQIKWIEEKENKAKEERKQYEGGTFENVANYISLYESTKERSYELVNTYMTD